MAAQSNKGSVERMANTVDLLLQAGANPQATDANGAIPLAYASKEEIKQKLQPRMPSLYKAIASGDVADVAAILASNGDTLDLNRAYYNSQTPLEWTIEKTIAALEEEELDISNLAAIVQQLFENGSESSQETTYNLLVALDQTYKSNSLGDFVSSQDTLKRLALASLAHQKEGSAPSNDACLLAHQAARRGQLAMLQFLIDQFGMDPNLGNRQGMTVLHFAARSGQLHIVQYLLGLNEGSGEWRVDVALQDSLGKTALDAARVNNKEHVVLLLESYMASMDVTHGVVAPE